MSFVFSGARVGACVALCAAITSIAGCGGGAPATPTPVVAASSTVASTTTTTIGGTVAPPPTTTVPVTPPPPTLAVTRFLAFGDSLTEGQSASLASRPMMLAPVTSYPSMLERDLRALYSVQDVRVVNSGRSGEWAEDGVYRLAGELRTAGPDAVLLLEGVNDLSAPGTPVMQPTLDALDYMVQLCRQQRAAVYLATLPPQRPGGVRADSVSLVPAFNEGLRRIARNRGAVLVDLEAAFGTDYSLLSEDGLHPNVAGYQVMAQAFLAAIRATLEKPAATTTTAAAAQTH